MWAVAALLLALLAGPARAANFETATVDAVHAVTSIWNGGLCGSLMARNPGNNPSTSWAGLFTITGCDKLTTGPNGNGVSEELSPNQYTFVPNDPAQMAIFSQSTVMVTYCCNAVDTSTIQASFRVIFSYDYRGAGYNPPPPTPPSPPPPSPRPPPPLPPTPPSPPPPSPTPPPSPSPPRPPRSPPSPPLPPAPAPAPAMAEELVSGQPSLPDTLTPEGGVLEPAPVEVAPPTTAPAAPEFGIQEASLTAGQATSGSSSLTLETQAAQAPAPAPNSATKAAGSLLVTLVVLAAAALAF